MTFKELQKLVQSETNNGLGSQEFKLFQKLQGLPFWTFDREQHKKEHIHTKGHCCFNHAIGLPQKDGHDMPLLPYQIMLYDVLQNHNHFRTHWQPPLGATDILDAVILELMFLKGWRERGCYIREIVWSPSKNYVRIYCILLCVRQVPNASYIYHNNVLSVGF